MSDNLTPEFAIMGHPNEGKSSVVSTLTEDDTVAISSEPGETRRCQTFPVTIDGREVIRFVDTPGFQNPGQTLKWIRAYQGPEDELAQRFREVHAGRPEFRHDVELFMPIARGAGIVYVADGSRPMRKVDRQEMEILRLTGRPRMAIINAKGDETRYIEQWESEFRRHFNIIRKFNAHRATYAERIRLLKSLTNIEQDWEPVLETVIAAFEEDWRNRSKQTASLICEMLEQCARHTVSRNISRQADTEEAQQSLREKFEGDLAEIERSTHAKIRRLYKHNVFQREMPEQSILREGLFDERTWQLLGLTPKQLIATAGVGGAAAGAGIDLALAGLSFGIFSAIGGATGAAWGAFGAKRLIDKKVVGKRLGGVKIKMGPVKGEQIFFILADRALIYFSVVINWAHAHRDAALNKRPVEDRAGFTAQWDKRERRLIGKWITAVRKGDEPKMAPHRAAVKEILLDQLQRISRMESNGAPQEEVPATEQSGIGDPAR